MQAKKLVVGIADNIKNFMTGLGLRESDKTTHSHFSNNTISIDQCRATYAKSWIARKAINSRISKMTKSGRSFKGLNEEEIAEYQRVWSELEIDKIIKKQLKSAMIIGGSAGFVIFQGDSPDNDEIIKSEIEFDKIKKGSIAKYVAVDCERVHPVRELIQDMLSPFFGEPKKLELKKSVSDKKTYHRSRIVLAMSSFECIDKDGKWNWPASMIDNIHSSLTGYATGIAGVGHAMTELGAKTIKIPGLLDSIKECGNDVIGNEMIARIGLLQLMRSTQQMTVLDANETLETDNQTLTGVADTIKTLRYDVGGAVSMSQQDLFGIAEGGLNTNGESLRKEQIQTITDHQESILRPILEQIDRFMIPNVFETPKPDFSFDFNPIEKKDRTKEISDKAADVNADINMLDFINDDQIAEKVLDTWKAKGYLPEDA